MCLLLVALYLLQVLTRLRCFCYFGFFTYLRCFMCLGCLTHLRCFTYLRCLTFLRWFTWGTYFRCFPYSRQFSLLRSFSNVRCFSSFRCFIYLTWFSLFSCPTQLISFFLLVVLHLLEMLFSGPSVKMLYLHEMLFFNSDALLTQDSFAPHVLHSFEILYLPLMLYWLWVLCLFHLLKVVEVLCFRCLTYLGCFPYWRCLTYLRYFTSGALITCGPFLLSGAYTLEVLLFPYMLFSAWDALITWSSLHI